MGRPKTSEVIIGQSNRSKGDSVSHVFVHTKRDGISCVVISNTEKGWGEGARRCLMIQTRQLTP